MAEIVADDQPFDSRGDLGARGARGVRRSSVQDGRSSKASTRAEGAGGTAVTLYRNNEFVDLCRGPHVRSTGRLKAFKLLRSAGAYWRGDEHKPQLQRIYGTAWESKKELDAYLNRLEEAEKRDHRKLGAAARALLVPARTGQRSGGLASEGRPAAQHHRGLQPQDPSGPRLRHRVHPARGQGQPVGDQSGHLEFYAEGMYPAMELDDGQEYR